MEKSFVVMSISRNDLIEQGYDEAMVNNLSDADMRYISSQIGEYFDDAFADAVSSAMNNLKNK